MLRPVLYFPASSLSLYAWSSLCYIYTILVICFKGIPVIFIFAPNLCDVLSSVEHYKEIFGLVTSDFHCMTKKLRRFLKYLLYVLQTKFKEVLPVYKRNENECIWFRLHLVLILRIISFKVKTMLCLFWMRTIYPFAHLNMRTFNQRKRCLPEKRSFIWSYSISGQYITTKLAFIIGWYIFALFEMTK